MVQEALYSSQASFSQLTNSSPQPIDGCPSPIVALIAELGVSEGRVMGTSARVWHREKLAATPGPALTCLKAGQELARPQAPPAAGFTSTVSFSLSMPRMSSASFS